MKSAEALDSTSVRRSQKSMVGKIWKIASGKKVKFLLKHKENERKVRFLASLFSAYPISLFKSEIFRHRFPYRTSSPGGVPRGPNLDPIAQLSSIGDLGRLQGRQIPQIRLEAHKGKMYSRKFIDHKICWFRTPHSLGPLIIHRGCRQWPDARSTTLTTIDWSSLLLWELATQDRWRSSSARYESKALQMILHKLIDYAHNVKIWQ